MNRKTWTKKDMPDLQGKVIIVTGGNSGLGFESVKAFATKGATVILACRSIEKGILAKAKIGEVRGEVFVMALDLNQPDTIRAFVEAFKTRFTRLDVLLNNAGVMQTPFSLSSFGVESQLSTNHLAHFMLTSLLLELIVKTPQSRVVSVSSLAHRNGVLNLEDVNYRNGVDYESMVAYRRSKLANLYFAYELQRYFEAHKIDAMSVVAHPGVAPTNLMNHKFSSLGQHFIRPLAKLFLQKVSVGALGQIRAAVDDDVSGGDFYGPSSNSEWRGYPIEVASIPLSHDKDTAKQLWLFSEKMTECSFSVKKN